MIPKVYSRRHPEAVPAGAVYVGRPSRWGNPFVVGVDGARGQCVRRFENWIKEPAQSALYDAVRRELSGKDLVCWCAPESCHADVLLQIANPGLIPPQIVTVEGVGADYLAWSRDRICELLERVAALEGRK